MTLTAQRLHNQHTIPDTNNGKRISKTQQAYNKSTYNRNNNHAALIDSQRRRQSRNQQTTSRGRLFLLWN